MTTCLLNDYSHNHNITLLQSYITRSVYYLLETEMGKVVILRPRTKS